MPTEMTETVNPPSDHGQALPVGTRLEEFVIERVLGSGGFGITYLARDSRLNRQVVIKENLPVQFCFRDTHSFTVAPRHSQGDDADNFAWSLDNFSKEAAMLASLDHPGIVKVLRSFEAFGTAYFVMPFVDGLALDDLVKQRKEKPFTEEELSRLLGKVLDALTYLHDRGIYHRDIKPGNILITNEGIPVLIDFGSARQRLSERSMTVVESPGYTPFEQLQSRGNVGPWSDLYALGATLVKLITGEAPPKTNDRSFGDPWQPLAGRADLTGKFSPAFLAGIDRSLRLPTEERWQDAGHWKETLVTAQIKPPPPIPRVIPDPPRAKEPSLHPAPRKQSGTPNPEPQKPRAKLPKGVRQSLIATVSCLALIGIAILLINNSGKGSSLAEDEAERQTEAVKGGIPSAATKNNRFMNSLGMKFVPVPIGSGPSAGKTVLFSIWETRRQDYEAYAKENIGVDGTWKNPGFEQTTTHPVVKVSYDDAVAFCKWLTEKERADLPVGAEYRLPTDAEWSYAVGIGELEDASATPKDKDKKIIDVYPWNGGKGTWPPPEGAGNYGNYESYSSSKITQDGYNQTSPVGAFASNANGLYDLGGNVWEWCGSYYDGSSGSRVLRGGSWYDGSSDPLLSSYRSNRTPGGRLIYYGFRCVLVLSPP